MKFSKAIIGAVAATALVVAGVATYSFLGEKDGFFAYVHIPAGGNQTQFYVFLSEEECRFDDEGETWKTALYYYPDTVGQRNACWRPFTDTDKVINLCLVGKDSRGSFRLSNACQPASKSRFLSTESLPENAQFD